MRKRMSEMKMIMENWRAAQLSEGTETVADLIKVIKGIKFAKAKGKGGKAMLKLVPFLGQAIYGGDLSDKKQPPGLQALAVDPDISRIVDNDIEKAFLSHLSQRLEAWPDPENASINDVDTTAMLQDFIASNFNNKTVKDS